MHSRVYASYVTLLTIGKVARQCGVSPDTLRHYERIGIFPKPARTASGYRQYPETTIARVQLVQRALAFGFSLNELVELLRVRDRGGVPCQSAYALLAAKLTDVEQRLEALTILRDELQATLASWETRRAEQPTGERANLLEALGHPSVPSKKGIRR